MCLAAIWYSSKVEWLQQRLYDPAKPKTPSGPLQKNLLTYGLNDHSPPLRNPLII